MKIFTKGRILLLAGLALCYSACKKDNSVKTATQTTVTSNTGYEALSSQVASNFSQALSGSMGGANLNEGLTPSFAGTYPQGASALCGFVANSNINYSTNVGDTIKTTVTGHSKFFFDCILGKPIGYTLVDALVTSGTAPGYAFIYDVAQGYQIKSLNTTATLLQCDGTLQAFKDITYTDKAYKPTSEHDAFVIVGAVVDISTKGKNTINAGYATFTTKGTRPDGTSWNYIGRMDFIGNNIGKLTFYGNVYLVNLGTGQIVKI